MKTNILLTGKPGVGKTTIIRKVLRSLDAEPGGFYTEEILGPKGRLGFSLNTLDGRCGILAHVDCDSPHRVSRYGVNVPDMLAIGVPALNDALANNPLIVADEIGRMETFCYEFCGAIEQCLDSPKPVLGTIQMRRSRFLDRIRAREDVELIEVIKKNRGFLPGIVAAKVQKLLTAPP
ncbi:MAG: nucleoside-triphosphatase [Armatimonadota bacterium]